MIYVIGGPTGSGKTTLAIELAKIWKVPIVNADAFQMYQGMDIGTNKDVERLKAFQTYFFNHVSPEEGMTVARYQKEVRALFFELLQTYPKIILVGGTGLYIKASLYPFHFADHQLEPDLSAFEKVDNLKLHQHLTELDAQAAKKIHPQNRRRVLRAIAINLATGKTKTEQEGKETSKPLFPCRVIAIQPDRNLIHQQLDQRVIEMFAKGLVKEVQQLKDRFGEKIHAFQAIGYKETLRYLNGEESLGRTIELIQTATRRYAKRQMTYFRHQLPTQWYPDWQTALKDLTT
jgi:tRNA dimethylallyltransferase